MRLINQVAGSKTMIIVICILFVLVGGAGFWMYRWQYQTAERVLQEWAAQRHLTVLEKSRANDPNTGPGNRYASNKQVVYRIRVKDDQGHVRSGFATIGSKTMGTLEPIIDVRLDPN